MLIEFKLSMPRNNSWNGKWTGENNYYARVRNLGVSKEDRALGEKILVKSPYDYDFGDGWVMRIYCKSVNSKEASKIRKESKGFCGYEWAIDSILSEQKIISPSSKAR